jgi:hypothetical protein
MDFDTYLFQNLSQLNKLFIDYNIIEELNRASFYGLFNLTSFMMKNNHVVTIKAHEFVMQTNKVHKFV